MARTVSIIGAGRLGRTLGKRLHQLGWRIGLVITRSTASSRAAVRAIGAGTPHAGLTSRALDADLILVTTPDGTLANVAQALAEMGGRECRGKVILHGSGALDSGVLAPLARRGAFTGSLHPMQTFSDGVMTNLRGVVFTIEGHPRARRLGRGIALALGGIPVALKGESKGAYHAGGTLVGGHALALVEAATQVLMRIGFTRRRAAQALLPLIRQTLDNFERLGPKASFTGPISRGDYATVKKHRDAFRKHPREFQDAYAAVAFLAGRVLSKNPEQTIKHLKLVLKSPRGGSR
ncbi:MAG TPA: Rossmann-like and DUF2520 domain-containing protein [Candidatus Binataceae bacterium]|nr:Rossmann-like and DUF2520 domain-containing protein [Candidatus Binataceae bacterium]